jgi:hypothetical protein
LKFLSLRHKINNIKYLCQISKNNPHIYQHAAARFTFGPIGGIMGHANRPQTITLLQIAGWGAF